MTRSEKRKRAVYLALAAALAAALFVSFCLGRYGVPLRETGAILADALLRRISRGRLGLTPFWDAGMASVVLQIRLPRIVLAAAVGCSLGAAGAVYQGVFQNPMASPDLLGATDGAAFGAALSILLGLGSRLTTVFAFLSALLTVALVFLVSRSSRGSRVLTLVLSGIMVSSLFSAATSYIKLVADPSDQLPAITYWLMGSLAGAKGKTLWLALPPMAVGLVPLLLLRWRISILSLGDDEARTLGVNAGRVRLAAVLSATLITAAGVAVSGAIGWVGLVVPHLCRRMVGGDYRSLLPTSMLFGAVFLLVVDDVSRCLLETEIPIGILTALIGAPFFLWLITRKEGRA